MSQGQFTLDDLGFTYVEGPPNNTFFENFEDVPNNPLFANPASPVNFTLGESPFSATFTGGITQDLFAGSPINETRYQTFPNFGFF